MQINQVSAFPYSFNNQTMYQGQDTQLTQGSSDSVYERADFKHAYEYLEYVEHNNTEVDWELLQHDSDTYTDIMLLRIMHIAFTEE